MRITPHIFEGFLKCLTKCWLRAANELPAGNAYAQWSAARADLCRAEGIKRLVAARREGECIVAPAAGNLKTTAWRLAVDVPAQTSNMETRIAAIERVPSIGRDKAAQFIAIRFAWPNKLGRHEKLSLAFDALALSETLGHDVPAGKIIHGDNHDVLKVKLPGLVKEARKLVEETAATPMVAIHRTFVEGVSHPSQRAGDLRFQQCECPKIPIVEGNSFSWIAPHGRAQGSSVIAGTGWLRRSR